MIKHWKQYLPVSLAFLVLGGVGFAYAIFGEADAAIQNVASSGAIIDLLKPESLYGESNYSEIQNYTRNLQP